jgi:hypothetical protein
VNAIRHETAAMLRIPERPVLGRRFRKQTLCELNIAALIFLKFHTALHPYCNRDRISCMYSPTKNKRHKIFGSNTTRLLALFLASSLTTATAAVAQSNQTAETYPISYTIESNPIPAEQEAAVAACYQQHKGTLYSYAGLNLTPAQIKKYNAITQSVGSRIGKINNNASKKQDALGGITMYLRNEDRSDAARELVITAMDAIALQNLPAAEKLRLLTASHGKYAVFEYGRYLVFSDAKIKASNVLGKEWESRMIGMMTSAQRIKFSSNLASGARYRSCAKDRPAPYSIPWFLGNFGDEKPTS